MSENQNFNPGDDAAVIVIDAWNRERPPYIIWRGKVLKVQKTGAVVTEKGNWRQDGRPMPSNPMRGKLVHLTPEVEADSALYKQILEAESYIFRKLDAFRRLKGVAAVELAEKLRPILGDEE